MAHPRRSNKPPVLAADSDDLFENSSDLNDLPSAKQRVSAYVRKNGGKLAAHHTDARAWTAEAPWADESMGDFSVLLNHLADLEKDPRGIRKFFDEAGPTYEKALIEEAYDRSEREFKEIDTLLKSSGYKFTSASTIDAIVAAVQQGQMLSAEDRAHMLEDFEKNARAAEEKGKKAVNDAEEKLKLQETELAERFEIVRQREAMASEMEARVQALELELAMSRMRDAHRDAEARVTLAIHQAEVEFRARHWPQYVNPDGSIKDLDWLSEN